MAGENPPPRIPSAVLNNFLYHVNRIDDLTCRRVSTRVNTQQSDFTVAHLDQYITEKTCFTVRAMIKQEQMQN